MHHTYLFCLLLVLPGFLFAQPAPAPPQQEPIAIVGATIHIGNGQILENGVILFEGGRITSVDLMTRNTEWQKDRYRQIRAEGKHVYPGLIALNTSLGLNEIGAIPATQDVNEFGPDNSNARTIVAYDADSRVIPTVRTNGILMAQIVPGSGRWSGLSSVVQLDAWNWEDAAYATDEGTFLRWPAPYARSGWWAEPGVTTRNKDYQKQIDEIDVFMREAAAYAQMATLEEKNLRFEGLRPVFSGQRHLYIDVDDALAIQDAVLWADKYKVSPVIVGARDSWMITDFLKEHQISVVLSQTHKLPAQPEDDILLPYKTPSLLASAGVSYAFSVDGYWQQRNLAYQAGQAAGWMPKEEALKAITLSPARILGLDDRIGSLEKGKDATLFICPGDVLDMRSSEVEQAFIQGREIDLDNKQKQLYRMYKEKYDRE
ncbi:MAG: amidohydrolase family protein [Saprospiraceae bacterium]|nr:amidohydrolase family protein [Saprospiraceae bacterium]